MLLTSRRAETAAHGVVLFASPALSGALTDFLSPVTWTQNKSGDQRVALWDDGLVCRSSASLQQSRHYPSVEDTFSTWLGLYLSQSALSTVECDVLPKIVTPQIGWQTTRT